MKRSTKRPSSPCHRIASGSFADSLKCPCPVRAITYVSGRSLLGARPCLPQPGELIARTLVGCASGAACCAVGFCGSRNAGTGKPPSPKYFATSASRNHFIAYQKPPNLGVGDFAARISILCSSQRYTRETDDHIDTTRFAP